MFHDLGVLRDILGASVEESARDALAAALYSRGFRLLRRPQGVQLDGEGELDAAVEVEGPEGQRLWASAEAKVRLPSVGLLGGREELIAPPVLPAA